MKSLKAKYKELVLAFEATKSFQKSVGTDSYTLIEQSGNFILDADNKNFMNLWSIIEHKRAQWRMTAA